VLTPLNPVLWRDPTFRSNYEALVDEVRRQDAGLMTIKTASRRNWPEGSPPTYSTWYEPFTDAERIRATVSWVLAHDGSPVSRRPATSGCCSTSSPPSATGSRPLMPKRC
jgi:hypothetical protein